MSNYCLPTVSPFRYAFQNHPKSGDKLKCAINNPGDLLRIQAVQGDFTVLQTDAAPGAKPFQ
jgi:hypothetical protein